MGASQRFIITKAYALDCVRGYHTYNGFLRGDADNILSVYRVKKWGVEIKIANRTKGGKP